MPFPQDRLEQVGANLVSRHSVKGAVRSDSFISNLLWGTSESLLTDLSCAWNGNKSNQFTGDSWIAESTLRAICWNSFPTRLKPEGCAPHAFCDASARHCPWNRWQGVSSSRSFLMAHQFCLKRHCSFHVRLMLHFFLYILIYLGRSGHILIFNQGSRWG